MAWQEKDSTKDDMLKDKDDELAELRKQMAMMEDKMATMSVKKPSVLGKALFSVASKIAPKHCRRRREAGKGGRRIPKQF